MSFLSARNPLVRGRTCRWLRLTLHPEKRIFRGAHSLRFAKLQVEVGLRLYLALLSVSQEPHEEWSMLDKLHRLKELRFLHSVDDWHQMRWIREGFARDYPDQPALHTAYLTEAVAALPTLTGLLARISALAAGLGCA